MGRADRERARQRDREPVRRGDLERAHQGNLDPGSRNDAAGRAALEIGTEVLITRCMFRGQTGVIEGFLTSGKLRIRVETRRSLAGARVDPAHLEPLGILAEGTEERD